MNDIFERIEMKLKNMSLRQVALKTYIMWSYLEQHPMDDKNDYYFYYPFYYDYMRGDCPYCEYHTGGCNKCILLNCNEHDSYFDTWDNSRNRKVRRIAAGNIAKIAWEDYKRLEHKE